MFRDLLVSAWVVYSSRNTLYPWKDIHLTTTSISFTIAREPSDHIQTYLYCGQADTIDIYIYPTLSNKVVAELVESAYETIAEEYQRHRNRERLVYGKKVILIEVVRSPRDLNHQPSVPLKYFSSEDHILSVESSYLQRWVIFISWIENLSSHIPLSVELSRSSTLTEPIFISWNNFTSNNTPYRWIESPLQRQPSYY